MQEQYEPKSLTVMKLSAAITLIAILTAFLPAHGDDVNSPEGWATCSSIHSAGDYDLTGRPVLHPQSGVLYLMRCSDGNAKLIVYPC